mgnify:FL=1|jgi:hypothetical protein
MFALAGMHMKELISITRNVAMNTIDLACWTALAPIVSKWRIARIEAACEEVRIQRKAKLLCQRLASQYEELTAPAW